MADEWTVERHLRDKPEQVVALYRRFIELAETCGPFTYAVAKTAITLKGSRRGFAGLTPRTATLDGYLDLQRRVEDVRIRRSSPYTKRLFVHHFRIVRAVRTRRRVRRVVDGGIFGRRGRAPPSAGRRVLTARQAVLVGDVDHAETVSLGVGEDHVVGVWGALVPVDLRRSE